MTLTGILNNWNHKRNAGGKLPGFPIPEREQFIIFEPETSFRGVAPVVRLKGTIAPPLDCIVLKPKGQTAKQFIGGFWGSNSGTQESAILYLEQKEK